MISKYLKSKNIINTIPPTIDENNLSDNFGLFYNLKENKQTSVFYYYSNIFTNYELEKIVAICKKLPQIQGTLGGNNINTKVRESKVSWVPINNQTLWLYQKLTDYVLDANENFFEYDLTKIEKLQFTTYYGDKNAFYSAHLDSNFDGNIEDRKLTFVLQLSDPENYRGGELQIHTSNHPSPVKKEKGLLTFFPSHTLHECTPVTSGIRYSLVGWVYGPKLK